MFHDWKHFVGEKKENIFCLQGKCFWTCKLMIDCLEMSETVDQPLLQWIKIRESKIISASQHINICDGKCV